MRLSNTWELSANVLVQLLFKVQTKYTNVSKERECVLTEPGKDNHGRNMYHLPNKILCMGGSIIVKTVILDSIIILFILTTTGVLHYQIKCLLSLNDFKQFNWREKERNSG